MSDKPIIKFSATKVYNQTHYKAACKISEALFLLLKKSTIHVEDLQYVGQMGFKIEFIGDIKSVTRDLDKPKVRITAQGVFYNDDDDQ